MELIIAIWGGVVSTILAIIQIRGFWKDRFKLNISLGLNCPDFKQNLITITNLFSRPITISNFELFWSKNINDADDFKRLSTGFEQDCCITIPAHSPRKLVFDDEYYFSVSPNKGRLYLKLSILGRKKPILKSLYPIEE